MTTSPQVPPHHGGEEWQDLDSARADYDPSLSEEILAQAKRNIEECRKTGIRLRLTDSAGQPLRGHAVTVEQSKHDFLFGDQVWSLDALYRDGKWESDRARAWRKRFRELFNAATSLCYWTERPRNDGSKTEDWQGEPRLENFWRTVEWTLGEGMIAKGHPLFWSIPKCTPEWVKRYDAETRMKFAEVRIRNLVARGKGKIRIWDAVNEPMWEPAPENLLVREWPHLEEIATIADYVERVLSWCREEDPDAIYLVNDYGMEEGGPEKVLRTTDGRAVTRASQRKRYHLLFEELANRGSLPDAIGLQSHSGWVKHHGEQWVAYHELSDLGLPLHITEFWAHTRELAQSGRYSEASLADLQAEYICNYLTCAFGHPAIDAFFCWGGFGHAVTWGQLSSHETTVLYDRLRHLWENEWRTRGEFRTDDDGVISFRGFYGEYALRSQPRDGGQIRGRVFSVNRGIDGLVTLIV